MKRVVPPLNNLSVPSSYQNSIKDGCLVLKEDQGVEWSDFIEIIQATIKNSQERVEWKISEVLLIVNAELEQTFEAKVNELKLKGCTDEQLQARCVFTKEAKADVEEIRYSGYSCKEVNSSEQFADSRNGVHVFTHFDRLLDWCSYKNMASPMYIMVYKTVFGRSCYVDLPSVDSNNNQTMSDFDTTLTQPSLEYDSYFIDENLKFDCKFEQYYPSMAYLYDMKTNGDVSLLVRHLLPFAILKCELLSKDYYLNDYMQQKASLLKDYPPERRYLKQAFYKTAKKKVEKASFYAPSVQARNTIDPLVQIEFYVIIGEFKIKRDTSMKINCYKQGDNLFGHIFNTNDSSYANEVSMGVSLLGTKLPSVYQSKSAQKKAAILPKIPINGIRNVPPVDACRQVSSETTSGLKAKEQSEFNPVPWHDSLVHAILEKLPSKVNSHKRNSIFIQEAMKKFPFMHNIFQHLEKDKKDSIDNRVSYLAKQNCASSSEDFEKILEEKFSMINNKHINSTVSAAPARPQPQSNSSIAIQRPAQPPPQPLAPQVPFQKMSSTDSMSNLFSQDLFFDLDQNMAAANILNLEKDLVNSIYNEIKENGALTAFTDLDVDNVVTHKQQQQFHPVFLMQHSTNFVYSLKEVEPLSQSKEVNSKVLICSTNDNQQRVNLENGDPRYFHLVDKFSAKLKSVAKILLRIDQQKVDLALTELNQFCEKCVSKLKADLQMTPIGKLIEFISFVECNIDFIDKTNYFDMRIDLGYSDTEDDELLNYDLVSNIYSHDCYLIELRIYLHQFFDVYFSELLANSRLMKSITKVKPAELALAGSSSTPRADPRLMKDRLNKSQFDNSVFLHKPFKTFRTKSYKGNHNVAPVERELISERTDESVVDAFTAVPSIPLTSDTVSDEMSTEKDIESKAALLPLKELIIQNTDLCDQFDENNFYLDLNCDGDNFGVEVDNLLKEIDNNILNLKKADVDASKAETRKEEKQAPEVHVIQESNTLISEIRKTVKKDKIKRLRSKSLVDEAKENPNETVAKKQRTRSEAQACEVSPNVEPIKKEFETEKMRDQLEKIIECATHDENSSLTGSEEEAYVVVKQQQLKPSEVISTSIETNASESTNLSRATSSGSRNRSTPQSTPSKSKEKKHESRHSSRSFRGDSRSRSRTRRRSRSSSLRRRSRSRSLRRRSRSDSRSRSYRKRSYSPSRHNSRRTTSRGNSRGNSKASSKISRNSLSFRNVFRSKRSRTRSNSRDRSKRTTDSEYKSRKRSRSRSSSGRNKRSRTRSPAKERDCRSKSAKSSSSSTASFKKSLFKEAVVNLNSQYNGKMYFPPVTTFEMAPYQPPFIHTIPANNLYSYPAPRLYGQYYRNPYRVNNVNNNNNIALTQSVEQTNPNENATSSTPPIALHEPSCASTPIHEQDDKK